MIALIRRTWNAVDAEERAQWWLLTTSDGWFALIGGVGVGGGAYALASAALYWRLVG